MRLLVTTTGTVVTHALHDSVTIVDGADILIEDGVIESIQASGELVEQFDANGGARQDLQVLDVGDKSIIPGLIDAHTHLIWDGDRSDEVGMRLRGMSYQDIAAQGGGIGRTVRATSNATLDHLRQIGISRSIIARRSGTTYLEAKSGYGLETQAELKLIQAAHNTGSLEGLPGTHTTWLGAHAIPDGDDEDSTVERLLDEQLPAVIAQGLADSVDVFCEPGWFSVESTERIMTNAMSQGLAGRLHIDEFVDGGGAALAAKLGVVTADHALKTSREGRVALAEADVITGYLPGTPHMMNLDMPEITATPGAFTIASDFNPNCPSLSLPFAASLAVHRAGVTPQDALAAVTSTAARSVPRRDGLAHGVLEQGAAGSLNVLSSRSWQGWCLSPGHDPFRWTVVDGHVTKHENTIRIVP